MIPISDTDREYFRACYPQTVSIGFTSAAHTYKTITNADIFGLVVSKNCASGKNLMPGDVVAGQMELQLLPDNFSGTKFEGGTMTIRIGCAPSGTPTMYTLGTYMIDSVSKKAASITVTGLDNMVKFDKYASLKSWWGDGKTISQIVSKCCSDCGVTLYTSVANFENASYTASYPSGNDITYRQLLSWAVGAMGKVAWIGYDGQLRVGYPSQNYLTGEQSALPTSTTPAPNGIPGKAIPGLVNGSWLSDTTVAENARFASDMDENATRITGIICGNTIEGSDTCAVDLSDNRLVQDEDIIGNLWQVCGVEYYPYEMECVPLPWIEPLDYLYFSRDSTYVRTVVTSHTFTLNGNSVISATGESPTDMAYSRTNAYTPAQQVEANKTNKAVDEALVTARETASQMITSALHGYVVFNDADGDGTPDEILIMDTADKNTATKVWRWNSAGLGYSSTGYNGTYGLAMTINGAIVADYITTGSLSADRISGGTITGVAYNNGSGTFSVDSSGNVTANSLSSNNATITGGSLNVTTDSSSFNVIKLSYGTSPSDMSLSISPMAIVQKFSNSTITTSLMAGGVCFKSGDGTANIGPEGIETFDEDDQPMGASNQYLGSISASGTKTLTLPKYTRGLLLIQSSSATTGLYSVVSWSSGAVYYSAIQAMNNITLAKSTNTLTITNGTSGNVYVTFLGNALL